MRPSRPPVTSFPLSAARRLGNRALAAPLESAPMSPGLRLLGAIAIILFLVVAGLLGGLQDLRMNIREDPALAVEVHAVSFPIPGIAGAEPYKVMDLRERYQFASVYLTNSDPPSEGTIMIVSRLPIANTAEGNQERGIKKEWKQGDFKREGEASQQLLQFRDQTLYATVQEFRAPDGRERRQMLVPLDWAEDRVTIQINGPSTEVTLEAMQAALNQIEGGPQPLFVEPVEGAETAEAEGAEAESEA